MKTFALFMLCIVSAVAASKEAKPNEYKCLKALDFSQTREDIDKCYGKPTEVIRVEDKRGLKFDVAFYLPKDEPSKNVLLKARYIAFPFDVRTNKVCEYWTGLFELKKPDKEFICHPCIGYKGENTCD